MKISDKKNRIKWVVIVLLVIIGVSLFFTPSTIFASEQEITIDSLYVDHEGKITFHIRNFRDTEECVRKVFQCYEEVDYKAVRFISNKGATHIEHKYMYVNDLKSNRFSFLKCDSIPFSLDVFHLGLIKEPKPMVFEAIAEEDRLYLKGDFDEMNFKILKLFKEAAILGRYEKEDYDTYILVNKYGEPKFEFSSYVTHTCPAYKIY